MQAIYVYNLIPSLLLNDGYISKANPFFSETVTITNGNKYLRILNNLKQNNEAQFFLASVFMSMLTVKIIYFLSLS